MRHAVLSLLQRYREGLSFQGMVRRLRLSEKEKALLERKLSALEKQGIVIKVKRRYFLPPRTSLVIGTVVAVHRGYGFVRSGEPAGEDIFIPGRHWGDARLGDTVDVVVSGKGRKGRPEGRIARVRKREQDTFLGVYREHWGRPAVMPLDSASWEALPLIRGGDSLPGPGSIIRVHRELGSLIDVLGGPEDPGVDVKVVIQRFGLFEDFSTEAALQAERISGKKTESGGRRDHREWLTVTIDDEEAQDHDDAVSIASAPGGNDVLGVHIADVSHYVKPETPLDREARLRGTSVYFPNRTLPMLPEPLSRRLCSLRPGEDKLTVSVLMEIDPRGKVVGVDMHPSLIRTRARLTYEQVWGFFRGEAAAAGELSSLKDPLVRMRSLAGRLRERRLRGGSLDFEMEEPELVYSAGKPQAVMFKRQNEAHQLIEEFMLAANEAVAAFLKKEEASFLYRVHPRPGAAELADLRRLLESLGMSLPEARPVRARDLQRVMREIEGRKEERFLKRQILKSLPLAVYSDLNQGHFALAKPVYTHFTSPIRRYPDLVVHRILKRFLAKEQGEDVPELSALGEHCSERERRAEEAERDLLEWRIHRLLASRLGETVNTVISGYSKAGIRMDLVDYGVSGFLPFSELGGDFFVKSGALGVKGRRTGKRLTAGQAFELQLAAVDPVLRRIDLAVMSDRNHGIRG